jgi:hypothetical protein
MHQNVTIFDMAKNRSVRQFSVPERRLIGWAGHAQPIGLFFIDNITSRCIQCILKSTILQFPADAYIALVFPRGVVTWNHTITDPEWHPFDFTAGSVTQTPDSFVLGDSATGNLYAVSLLNWQSKKFATAGGPISYLFTSQFGSGEFGIVSVSNSLIEFFSGSGKQTAQLPTESCKIVCFDVFSSTLFCLRRSIVRSYSILPGKIEKIGECSFTGVSVPETKSTNYSVLAICPCHLPGSIHPLFFALCDGGSLLIGSPSRVVQKVQAYPSPAFTKKINSSIALPHPTDMSLIIIWSRNDMLILDISAHLPQVVPSPAVRAFFRQSQVLEGISKVSRIVNFFSSLTAQHLSRHLQRGHSTAHRRA